MTSLISRHVMELGFAEIGVKQFMKMPITLR